MKDAGLKEPILAGDEFHDNGSASQSMTAYEKKEMETYQRHYACEFGCKLRKVAPEEIEKTQKARKQLFLASGFCVLFMIAEIIGGFIANSLALLSDATHLLSDFAGLMISITALWLVQKEAGQRYSFGYHRAEIIGALFSIILIWGLTIWLVTEAIRRLIDRPAVDGKVMFIVACLGILVNIIMGAILFQGGHHSHGLGGGGHAHDDNSHAHKHSHAGGNAHGAHKHEHKHGQKHDHSHKHEHGQKHDHSHKHDNAHKHDNGHKHEHKHGSDSKKGDQRNINVRSAFVHVLGDLVQSIGVVVAAAFIWADHQLRILDPICTLIFSVIVVFTTTTLVRDAIDVLMENVPKHINLEKLVEDLAQLPDVADVHDLHIWNLSVGKPALSVHLLAKATTFDGEGKIIPACADGILRKAQKLCADEYHIYHSTIQIEYPRDHHMKVSEISCPTYCGDGHKDATRPKDIEQGNKENNEKEDSHLELSEKST